MESNSFAHGVSNTVIPAEPGDSTAASKNLPQSLCQVLEAEFCSIHGSTAIELDQSYQLDRDARTAQAMDKLKEAIRSRKQKIQQKETKKKKAQKKKVQSAEVVPVEKEQESLGPQNEVSAGISEEELKKELKEQIRKKPSLLNAAECGAIFERIHRMAENAPAKKYAHSALCLSGGGVRSATFALGVIQGLAEKELLGEFAYLSTVSGGGYIGSWLSSWISRSKRKRCKPGKADDGCKYFDPGIRRPVRNNRAQNNADGQIESSTEGSRVKKTASPVIDALAGGGDATNAPNDPKTNAPADIAIRAAPGENSSHAFQTEPEPISHLREFSNFLTPKLGLLSGDTYAVAAIVFRNLVLNWLVIVPAFLLVLLTPRLALSLELSEVGKKPFISHVATVLAFLSGVAALTNIVGNKGRTQSNVILWCVLPLTGACALITLAWFWAHTAFPPSGYFSGEGTRMAFYVGWGGLTALLATLLVAWMRVKKRQTIARAWCFELSCITAVFAASGILVWWVGDNAAARLRENAIEVVEAARIPGPSLTWILSSRDTEGGTVGGMPSLSPVVQIENPLPRADRWPRIGYSELVRNLVAINAVCFGFPLLLVLIFLANTIITGLLSCQMSDENREWYSRLSGLAFLVALICCGVGLLVLNGPAWLVSAWDYTPTLLISVAGGSALVTIFGGKSHKMPANKDADSKHGMSSLMVAYAVKLALPIFLVVLVMLFSLLTTLILQKMGGDEPNPRNHYQTLCGTDLLSFFLFALGAGLLTWLMSATVNINKFSLLAMYRNRLCRAYLGASNDLREPNLFTGFDPADNLELIELRNQRPFHVINTTLNIVSGGNLAWQQRMAESFTMTPLTCGSSTLGYRDSEEYGRSKQQRMTLGTAVAISGAAVSPNHGYNSSTAVAFLLTFFNARLGGWFGNPGHAGKKTWRNAAPKLALKSLLAEAFGLTDNERPYVNLSDGGHFENLGLYEMVMRRCRFIVICDAGADPKYMFEDLGNAVAKIRVDFGIRITFDPDFAIEKYQFENPSATGRHCAIGTIHYGDVDGLSSESSESQRDGRIIYIKPVLCGTEPMDVFHYAKENSAFPHEPTTDQWFTEAQFESYRMLGWHTINQICKSVLSRQEMKLEGLSRFEALARAHCNAEKHERAPRNEVTKGQCGWSLNRFDFFRGVHIKQQHPAVPAS